MAPISMVLVEPQAIFLSGVERELEGESDIDVIGTATSGAEGLTLVRELHPNIAMIALQMEDLDGVSLLTELKDVFGTKTIILTAEDDDETVFECMMLGAQGYLFKYGVSDLAHWIRRAYSGEIVMCSQSLRAFISAVRRHEVLKRVNNIVPAGADNPLTQRERQVLTMVGRGISHKEIADALALSVTTVKTHVRNSYRKLGVNRSTAAIQKALDLGYIDRRQNGSPSF